MSFFVLIAIIALLLIVYTIKTPAVALVSVWCMYAMEQWAQGSSSFFIRHGTLINLSVGTFVAVGVVIKFFKYHNIFKNYPKIALPVLLLFIYSFISIYWSPRIDLSYAQWDKYWPYFITFILLTPVLITRDEEFSSVFNIFCIIGAISVYALLFHVEWVSRQIVFIGGRFSNKLHGNPLAVAQMAGYLFFSCMYMLGKNSSNKLYLLFNLLKWVIAGLCLLLIVKSGSRGQLLALIFTFIMFYPLVYKVTSFKGFVLVSIIVFIVASAIFWGLDEYWSKSGRWNQEQMKHSVSGRFDNAFTLLNHWYKDPLTILFGLGNSASFDPKIIGIYPHFVPFEILGEEGLIGFFIYILILFGIIRIGFRITKLTQQGTNNRQYAVILLAMVCYSFFLSLKQSSLLGNMDFFMAAIILGKFELMVKH